MGEGRTPHRGRCGGSKLKGEREPRISCLHPLTLLPADKRYDLASTHKGSSLHVRATAASRRARTRRTRTGTANDQRASSRTRTTRHACERTSRSASDATTPCSYSHPHLRAANWRARARTTSTPCATVSATDGARTDTTSTSRATAASTSAVCPACLPTTTSHVRSGTTPLPASARLLRSSSYVLPCLPPAAGCTRLLVSAAAHATSRCCSCQRTRTRTHSRTHTRAHTCAYTSTRTRSH